MSAQLDLDVLLARVQATAAMLTQVSRQLSVVVQELSETSDSDISDENDGDQP